jgi:hypothetical protein
VYIYGGTVTANGGGNGAVGIGKRKDGDGNGTLIVGDGMSVYGGDSENPTDVISKTNGDHNRCIYMKVEPTTYPLYIGGKQVT